jgi:glucuronate isomerase
VISRKLSHTYGSNLFEYDAEAKQFTALASKLGIAKDIVPFHIHIMSQWTAETKTFQRVRSLWAGEVAYADLYMNEDSGISLIILRE